MSLANQGKAAYFEGDNRSARGLVEASLATMRELKDDWHIAYSLVILGLISCSEHRWGEATARYHEALRILQEVEGKSLIIEALEGLGLVAEAADEPERAARLLAAAESLRAATGALPIRPQDPGYARYRAHALARRCESAYPGAWAEGERMSLDQIIAYALETTGSDEPSA